MAGIFVSVKLVMKKTESRWDIPKETIAQKQGTSS
jgi:hypothetical protein